MQLLISKDLVAVVDSHEGLPKSKIRVEIAFVLFFKQSKRTTICVTVKQYGVSLDRLQG